MPENKCASLIRTSLVDYPGLVSAAVFFRGCNLRCPYCYNINLVEPATAFSADDGLVSLEEIKKHLEKRRNVLQGLVVSGGEPLLNPGCIPLIRLAKDLGYRVKLDTNGTNPDILESIMKDEGLRVDYIAMDIKTSLAKYTLMKGMAEKSPERTRKALLRTIKIMKDLPSSCREWRTVLVPGLVDKGDIEEMAALLPEDASWYFAPFMNGSCLEPSFNDLSPYTDEEISILVDKARSFIKEAALR